MNNSKNHFIKRQYPRHKQKKIDTQVSPSDTLFGKLLESSNYFNNSKNDVNGSKIEVGFLGLSTIALKFVKTFINAGYTVVAWTENSSIDDELKLEDVELLETPQAVVEAANIIFSFASDSDAAIDLVFGDNGVLQAKSLSKSKGYVEMTHIDPKTSQKIADAIMVKGGRYIEAQLQEHENQLKEGSLIILAAGNKSLFDECQKYFLTITEHLFYFGEEGNASQVNLILQTIRGIIITAVTEGMALAERAGLQKKDVLTILKATDFASPLIIEKCEAIISDDSTPNDVLLRLQKDLQLSIQISNDMQLSLPLTAATNEVFKTAKCSLSDFDASVIYFNCNF